MSLYPFLFEPIYKPKVWGGRALATLGRELPGDASEPIGESWELVDMDQTSVSGAGGDPAHSVAANGALAGQTLGQLIGRFGEQLMGDLSLTPEGKFPLLVKILDAQQNLSVQVHPSPAYAATHADAHLKDEAWYILGAQAGAKIYKGIKAGTTPQDLRDAIADNTVEDLMIVVPAKVGDCHYLPSGTCHALGAGILVAEVQTPSDTTFRVYDWGRTGRDLHIEQALASIEFGPAPTARFEPRTRIENDQATSVRLVHCEFFCMTRRDWRDQTDAPLPMGQPRVWMILSGSATIQAGDRSFEPVSVGAADTLLLPAHLPGARIHQTQGLSVLEVAFPQAP